MSITIEPYRNYESELRIGLRLGAGGYAKVLTRAEAANLRDALDVALFEPNARSTALEAENEALRKECDLASRDCAAALADPLDEALALVPSLTADQRRVLVLACEGVWPAG
jgi:hypothetical protein